MKSREFLRESTEAVYHVTFSAHVPAILEKGLLPLQTSNWANGEGERYNAGGVFAFAHPMDAFKWAFNQNFQFKKPVSIVKFTRTNDWHKDPSDDITLQMGAGDALRADGFIGPENVIKVVNFDELGNPQELGISQAEWFTQIQDTLTN
jgi:hypothetical protein